MARIFWGGFVAAVIVLLMSVTAWAAPLQTISEYCTAHQDECQRGTVVLNAMRGTGTNLEYIVEVDPTTGAIPTSGGGGGGGGFPTGGASALLYQNNYSDFPVTSAYTEISASLPLDINAFLVFDSSGVLLALATGGIGSEVDFAYIPPGGTSAGIPIKVAAGQRLSIHAAGGVNAAGGYIALTGIK
jgi:hypothetical protein